MRKTITGIITVLSISLSLHAQVAGEQANMGGSITTLDQQGLIGDRSVSRDSTVVDREMPYYEEQGIAYRKRKN